MGPRLLKLLLLLLLTAVQQACCLVRLDLSQSAWQLSSSNRSISVTTRLPAHVLGVLAAAGVVQQDPLYRYGELTTRWVSEDTWNFTVTWPGQQHREVAACRHVLLVMHGIDTFGHVVLNGRHVLAADNAHRSWWVVLKDASLLREGANMLSVVLQPAVAVALRNKALNAYRIPTMAVPGGFDVYNFARKPASDFGWDWGPAFAPAGITGSVELLGFSRATLIGALVNQQLVNGTFLLTVTAQLVVPEAGDCGQLTANIHTLGVKSEEQVTLQAGQVGGNNLQALANIQLAIAADQVQLWQPAGRLPRGQKQALYDVNVTFKPAAQLGACKATTGTSSSSSSAADSSSNIAGSDNDSNKATAADGEIDESCTAGDRGASSVTRRIGFRTIELVRQPIQQTAAKMINNPAAATPDSSSSSSSTSAQLPAASAADTQTEQPAAIHAAAAAADSSSVTPADANSWAHVSGVWQLVRNVSQSPVWWHPQLPPGRDWPLPVSYLYHPSIINSVIDTPAGSSVGDESNKDRVADSEHSSSSQQHLTAAGDTARDHAVTDVTEEGESFYFRVNGVPLYAKGANLIPLHVLSSAVSDDDVARLLQSAAAANMNMVRIWGGGLYQRGALYAAADELGLLVWQEAMFACSPYPRDGAFVSNVEAEVAQQLLRLGSHPSIALWGGNNEIEASLEWYDETRSNLALFAVDYQALFVDTIGRVVQQMLPGVPWVDSSPSNGIITLAQPLSSQRNEATNAGAAAAAAAADVQQQQQAIKRWGNPQNPKYGDVHFYDYKNDCQDWRTYPAARFISEYGWQSYPSWATYSAATAAQDWAVASDMTEFRQRHPNGTVELLAQLQRRFKLPHPWLQLLQLHSQHQQQQQHTQEPKPRSCSSSAGWFGVWGCWRQKVARSMLWLQPLLDILPERYAKLLPTRWLSALQLLLPDSSSKVAPRTTTTTTSSSSSSNKLAAGSDMRHYIYLTQLQQMLCYETAVSYWRRLRSDTAVQTMGVLYWQLNDIWQGASWSSLDYGGVWKPLHYGLGRWFADLALSVRHDLHIDTIHVYVVSDMPRPIEAQLTVRMLSLADTPESCASSSSSSTSTSSGRPAKTLRQQHASPQQPAAEPTAPAAAAAEAAPWAKHSEVSLLTLPPASAVLVWSGTAQQLLAAAPGCSRTSCYVHVSLAAAAAGGSAAAAAADDVGDMQQVQEATVWLAPFAAMDLPPPQLQLSEFEFVAVDLEMNLTRPSHSSDSGSSSSSGIWAGGKSGEVAFTVSSSRVAAFAVWEMATQEQQQQLLPGHFSENAVTVHPCEPRVVRFVPQLGLSSWDAYMAKVRQWQQQQQQQAGAVWGGVTANGESSSSRGAFDDTSSERLLALLLQHSIAASSLYNHQQFEPSLSL